MNTTVNLKIKKRREDAVIPSYAHATDAGLDLVATSHEYVQDMDCDVYGTGLSMEIPEGHVGLVFPRSSNRKTESYMPNSVGVIDSGYRGEVMVTFKNRLPLGIDIPYKEGDRIAQLIVIPIPKVVIEVVDELSESDRGEGGHGSTGR